MADRDLPDLADPRYARLDSGTERWGTLRFVFNQNALFRADTAARRELGKPFHQMEEASFGIAELQILLWAALEAYRIKADGRAKAWTLEEVGDMIDEVGWEKITPVLNAARQMASAPERRGGAAKEEGPKGAAGAPTGTPS